MNGNLLEKFRLSDYRGTETDKYSVWVYDGGDVLSAYEDEQPNTVEVWFRFYKFNHMYWRLLEDECIDEVKGYAFYNFNKLKLFMIRRMLCSTSIPWVRVEYDGDGYLTESSFDTFMRIHPRILRVLMEKMDILPKPMRKSEEKELEKQCSILFGKGEGVTNPHEYITLYCNLMAFWDKFGMNYFDILMLPQDVFSALKKVMTLDSMYKSEKMEDLSKSARQPNDMRRNGRSVNF